MINPNLNPLNTYDTPQTPMKPGFDIEQTLKSLKPEEAWLAQSVAGVSRTRNSFDTVMQGAFMGLSPQDQAEQIDAQRAAQEAYRMAQDSMNRSTEEFNTFMEQLKGEVNNPVEIPQPGDLQQPGMDQLLLAAAGSILFPNQALEIGSLPYQEMSRRRAEDYQQRLIKYESQVKNRSERINLIGRQLEMAQTAQRESARELSNLSEEMRRRGDQSKAEGMKWLAELTTVQDEGALNTILDVMQKRYPGQLPEQKTIDSIRTRIKQIEAAKAEKLRLEQEKINADKANDRIKAWNLELEALWKGTPSKDWPKVKQELSQKLQSILPGITEFGGDPGLLHNIPDQAHADVLNAEQDNIRADNARTFAETMREKEFGLSEQRFGLEQGKVKAIGKYTPEQVNSQKKQVTDSESKYYGINPTQYSDPEARSKAEGAKDQQRRDWAGKWITLKSMQGIQIDPQAAEFLTPEIVKNPDAYVKQIAMVGGPMRSLVIATMLRPILKNKDLKGVSPGPTKPVNIGIGKEIGLPPGFKIVK